MELFNPVDYSKNWTKGGFLIGIDIGTTYSGASYAYHKRGILKDQVTISTLCLWPAPPGVNLGDIKIPSTVSYDVNGNITWGLGNEGKEHVISWFKLLLLDDNDLPPEFRESKQTQEAKRLIGVFGKSPVQVVADLLRNIFEHIVVYMGREKTDKFVKENPFHVILTVPAIWKGRALIRMQEAVELSGILADRPNQVLKTTYMFATEPEAAALATLPELRKWDTLLPGNTFVVADLGGGTIDCVSYVINSHEPFELRKIVEGGGALCGAVFLHQSFNMAIKKKVFDPEGKTWDELHPLEQEKIMGIWDQFNRGIHITEPDGTLIMNVYPNSSGYNSGDIKRLSVHFSRDEVYDIFQVVMPTIESLVERQVKAIRERTLKSPKVILLVGGLAQCLYIVESLQKCYFEQIPIVEERGNQPRAAVSKGAVICGMEQRALIRSHIARFSYGYFLNKVFQEGVHHVEDRFYDAARNCYMARDQMEWVIRRGDNVETHGRKVREYEMLYSSRARGVHGSEEVIYESKGANSSDRKAELWNEDGFQVAAVIRVQTPCPVERLPKLKRGGNVWKPGEGRGMLDEGPFFSSGRIGSESRKVFTDDLVPAGCYYFHVPPFTNDEPYPIVPSFRDWIYPSETPKPWRALKIEHTAAIATHPRTPSTNTPNTDIPSANTSHPYTDGFIPPILQSLSSYDGNRRPCPVTYDLTSTEEGHVMPITSRNWVAINDIARFKPNDGIRFKSFIDHPCNTIILRKDIHTLYENNYIIMVPKPDLAYEGKYCLVEFFFVRFAWAIFTHYTINMLDSDNANNEYSVHYVVINEDGSRTYEHKMILSSEMDKLLNIATDEKGRKRSNSYVAGAGVDSAPNKRRELRYSWRTGEMEWESDDDGFEPSDHGGLSHNYSESDCLSDDCE
ncbi:uncharacterized protein F4812DRAFT_460742 [Daldinia caldariorum]|uniref:uncharacterized protein n=1 Tax=Daldinia caldariorum TaxID=326644 RepID=UPI0020084287|nr:uncharacterized protein F4812DRAFT_460742 [Daldinia caldariorum]KAI1466472.1 hypothetical protein F4812DRAFT_460742 [Daldinia caldariorum]